MDNNIINKIDENIKWNKKAHYERLLVEEINRIRKENSVDSLQLNLSVVSIMVSIVLGVLNFNKDSLGYEKLIYILLICMWVPNSYLVYKFKFIKKSIKLSSIYNLTSETWRNSLFKMFILDELQKRLVLSECKYRNINDYELYLIELCEKKPFAKELYVDVSMSNLNIYISNILDDYYSEIGLVSKCLTNLIILQNDLKFVNERRKEYTFHLDVTKILILRNSRGFEFFKESDKNRWYIKKS